MGKANDCCLCRGCTEQVWPDGNILHNNRIEATAQRTWHERRLVPSHGRRIGYDEALRPPTSEHRETFRGSILEDSHQIGIHPGTPHDRLRDYSSFMSATAPDQSQPLSEFFNESTVDYAPSAYPMTDLSIGIQPQRSSSISSPAPYSFANALGDQLDQANPSISRRPNRQPAHKFRATTTDYPDTLSDNIIAGDRVMLNPHTYSGPQPAFENPTLSYGQSRVPTHQEIALLRNQSVVSDEAYPWGSVAPTSHPAPATFLSGHGDPMTQDGSLPPRLQDLSLREKSVTTDSMSENEQDEARRSVEDMRPRRRQRPKPYTRRSFSTEEKENQAIKKHKQLVCNYHRKNKLKCPRLCEDDPVCNFTDNFIPGPRSRGSSFTGSITSPNRSYTNSVVSQGFEDQSQRLRPDAYDLSRPPGAFPKSPISFASDSEILSSTTESGTRFAQSLTQFEEYPRDIYNIDEGIE